MSSAEGSTLTYNRHGSTQLKSGRRSYWWLTYKVTAFLLRLQMRYANTVTKRRELIDHFGVLQGSHYDTIKMSYDTIPAEVSRYHAVLC